MHLESNYQARQSLNHEYAKIKGAASINDVAIGFGKGWVVFAILSTLASAFSFYQDFYKSLGVINTIIVVIIFLIAYSSASGENLSKMDVSETYVKMVGGSLSLLYIIGGVAVISIVASEIYSFFK
jgi:lipid-A-disaccharide synthase-like uncharacterized protein